MKKIGLLIVSLLFLCSPAMAAPSVPSDLTLTSTDTTITVKWSKNTDSDTTGYYIYYGTSSGSLNTRLTASGISTVTYTITGLTASTTYYVAISAYNTTTESDQTDTESIATDSSSTKPDTPSGFKITSLDTITEDSIPVSWNRLTYDYVSTYKIYYSLTSEDYSGDLYATAGNSESSTTVSSLASNTRYFFKLTAISLTAEESDPTDEIAADTLPDTLPPPAPVISKAAMSGPMEITISYSNPLPGLADFKGFMLKYGTTPGVYTEAIDMGTDTSYTLANLIEDATYYFTVSASDIKGNESSNATEVSVKVEPYVTLLNQDKSFGGGCVVNTAWSGPGSAWSCAMMLISIGLIASIRFKKGSGVFVFALIMAASFLTFTPELHAEETSPDGSSGKNTFGVKYGLFFPSDSLYEDIYEPTTGPVSGFYERRIKDNFFASIEGGYQYYTGRARTISGAETDLKTEIELIPVAATLFYEYPMYRFIHFYGGAGLDYWYVKESPESRSGLPDIKEWVSGYHVNLGMKLFTTDLDYPGVGVQFETVYSHIDRFGQNDTNLGGLSATIGIFYRF